MLLNVFKVITFQQLGAPHETLMAPGSLITISVDWKINESACVITV